MLDADSITIAMGDMSGSVMLTANESVTVVATGSGVSGLMQVAVTATDAPEPVPALPLIAQWLARAGPAGWRRAAAVSAAASGLVRRAHRLF